MARRDGQHRPRPTPGRARSRLALLTLSALLMAGCGCEGEPPEAADGTTAESGAAAAGSPAAAPALTVSLGQVTTARATRLVTATGTVAPWREQIIGSEIGGLGIVELAVEEGDVVKKGQVLARLNDSVLRASLAQARAGVTEAEATLAQARSDLARARELQDRGHVSAQALETRETQAASAAARLEVARAAVKEVEARLAQTRIVAPTDGIVASRRAVLGRVVATGEELFRIVQEGKLELDAEVPEADLPRIAEGQTARVRREGGPPVPATVRSIEPIVDPRTRLGIANIALPPESGLRVGMFATADIEVGGDEVMAIPADSVVRREGRATVFVIEGTDADPIVRRAQIVTGSALAGGLIELREGLQPGTRLVTRGAGFLNDGDHVRIATEAAATPAAPPPTLEAAGTPAETPR